MTFLAVHRSIPVNPDQARALPQSSVFCAVLVVVASKMAVLSANYANYAKNRIRRHPRLEYCGPAMGGDDRSLGFLGSMRGNDGVCAWLPGGGH